VLCSPFVLGGANTPASVPATVAQLNAEALSALAYTQVIRRGCPAIYGHYLSTVSMKSGAPMAGTPEISLMNFMIGQMARHYGVPWRTSNTLGGAKTFDAQAGYESATTLMAVMHAGANYIWHSAGWNEAGMHCSVAKFVVDAEQCAMAYRMAEGPKWDDFDEALKAVPDVGPGGHYLGHPHTQENFQTAFSCPSCSTTTPSSNGSPTARKEITARALDHAAEAAGRLRGTETRRGQGRSAARLHRPARAGNSGGRGAQPGLLKGRARGLTRAGRAIPSNAGSVRRRYRLAGAGAGVSAGPRR
jgi:trimethylamine--corrinoid protein Co-methyltransferase